MQPTFLSRLRTHVSSALKKKKIQYPGSHLRVEPKQILNSRYEIVKQVGSGQHSTVWLAEDMKSSTRKSFAIKVLTDYVTSLQGVHAFELDVLKRISSKQAAPHEKHLLHLYDHFDVRGTDGQHLCLVNELLGPSLLDIRSSTRNGALPAFLIKRIVRQLLQGLEVLHDKCHSVHTDIKWDNILFKSTAQDTDISSYAKIDIVLVDFGTAMPEGTDHERLIQPEALRSPEVLLGCTWDTKADIWNLGCIIFEFLIGQQLFKPRASESWSAEQYHMARIYSTLFDEHDRESLIEFFRHGKNFATFFNGDRLRISPAEREPMKGILEHYGLYTPELDEFLLAMLRIHPADRLSANQLLSLPWLQE